MVDPAGVGLGVGLEERMGLPAAGGLQPPPTRQTECVSLRRKISDEATEDFGPPAGPQPDPTAGQPVEEADWEWVKTTMTTGF